MTRVNQLQESEPLLFPMGELFPMESTQSTIVSPSTTKGLEKPTKPAILATLQSNQDSLEALLSKVNAKGLYLNDAWRNPYMRVSVNRASGDMNVNYTNPLHISKSKDKHTECSNHYQAKLVYIDPQMRVWLSELSLLFDRDPQMLRYAMEANQSAYCSEYSIGEWTMQKSAKLMPRLHFIQSESELMDILSQNHPYTATWAKESRCDVRTCLLAPHIEILSKAGYAFADVFKRYDRLKDDTCAIFNRLCQCGSKPKDIFKTSKPVYSVLKQESNLEIWDCYRKMMKLGKIGADTIQQAYDQGYDRKDLEYFNSILAKRYNDKPVFTWNSLMQYLVRLDTFEAISRHEAFVLLNDYLSMCNQLHMEPRIDGDSLKREHDIAARNCRNRRDEIMAERMQAGCERMRKYDYTERVYFVRGIRGYEDLLDEANQQHNCVASYASNIANGTSYIYVMREVANPDKSLITIELSPNGKSIRQKYLAYNQPIHSKSQSEFIDRWMKRNREIG